MTSLQPPPVATAPAAGWYADAADPTRERWWDGTSWTDVTRTRTSAPAPRNGTAYWSLALGVVAVAIGVAALAAGAGGVWLSTSGIVAILSGVRALRLHRAGAATAFAPAVAGIALGGLGALMVVVALVLHLGFTVFVSDADTLDGAAQGGTSQGDGAAPAPSASTGTVTGTPTDVQPPSVLPDDALSTYTALPVRSVTTMAAGCGVLLGQPEALPIQTTAHSAARRMQDYLNLQMQVMAQRLAPSGVTATAWPAAIDLDPDTLTVFTPAPACTALGLLPKSTEIRYGTSPNRAQVAVAIENTPDRVGALWRSVDDTVYTL